MKTNIRHFHYSFILSTAAIILGTIVIGLSDQYLLPSSVLITLGIVLSFLSLKEMQQLKKDNTN